MQKQSQQLQDAHGVRDKQRVQMHQVAANWGPWIRATGARGICTQHDKE